MSIESKILEDFIVISLEHIRSTTGITFKTIDAWVVPLDILI